MHATTSRYVPIGVLVVSEADASTNSSPTPLSNPHPTHSSPTHHPPTHSATLVAYATHPPTPPIQSPGSLTPHPPAHPQTHHHSSPSCYIHDVLHAAHGVVAQQQRMSNTPNGPIRTWAARNLWLLFHTFINTHTSQVPLVCKGMHWYCNAAGVRYS